MRYPQIDTLTRAPTAGSFFGGFRKSRTGLYFGRETVALLRTTLDRAWARLPQSEQAKTTRSVLAERILKAAAQGERDADGLLTANRPAMKVAD